ncbi:hypothetical protein BJF82_12605 [Kytococcus sp. CUA-901]|nr:hypothetical protein BJF82_12605 [Kytococcus sp. CUA-901]
MRFVQTARTPTGRQYSWDAESETGVQMADVLRRRRALFVETFGREPGPEDPLFFDAEAREPRPLEELDFDWDMIFEPSTPPASTLPTPRRGASSATSSPR